MTPALTAPDPTIFPADVLAFAAERGVTDYLAPLYELATDCFPGTDVTVQVERDYEIPDLGWIVYRMAARDWPYDRSWAAKERWDSTVHATLPKDVRGLFGLDVR